MSEEVQQPEVSPEDRLAIAAGIMPEERPRDEKGRFAAKEPQEPEQQVQESQETQGTQEPQPEQHTEEEVIDWDQVKELKVRVPMKNGEKEWVDELTFEDLRNQRMMHADYMARRREWDEKEKSFQTQMKESLDKERQQYLGTLQVLQQAVLKAADAELGSVDWQRLAAEDPSSYVRLQARAQQLSETFKQIEAEQRKIQEQQRKELEELQTKMLQESETKLKEAIPNWGEETQKALFKRGLEYGFKPEELGRVYDHRIVQVLHDAHQFRLMQEGKSTAEKKVAQVPPVLRPKAQAQKVNPQVQQWQQAREKLKANPNDMDAIADVMGRFV